MRESGLRHELSFRSVQRIDAPLCAGVSEQPAVQVRAGHGGDLRRSLGKKGEGADSGHGRPAARKAAINRYLWDALRRGCTRTTTSRRGSDSSYLYATVFYPLWAGLSLAAAGCRELQKALPRLEAEHGLAMSDTISGMQWDRPFGWAPEVWFAVLGLRGTGL